MRIVKNPDMWPGYPFDWKRKNRKYPWDEWTDGQWREAEKGLDFDCTALSFATAVYHHARVSGKKAVTSVDGDFVLFQLRPAEEEQDG